MRVYWLLGATMYGCGGTSPEPKTPDSTAPVMDTSEAPAEDTQSEVEDEGPTLTFLSGEWSVDECATTCLSVRLTHDSEPIANVPVDFWVENSVLQRSVSTNEDGIAEGCTDRLPVGSWRAVAVALVEGESIQTVESMTVEPFGFADGVARTPGTGLPYTPFFTRFADNPVLNPGASGSFDSVGVLLPSVVRTDDGWVMWYAGTQDVDYTVGVAASMDGTHWVRRHTSVLPPDFTEGSWKRYATNGPMIVPDGEGWRVYYAGRAEESRDISIGMAIGGSADVVSDFPANPVFEWSEAEVDWAGQAVAHPAIVHHPDGHWEMWYSTGLHKLGYAYSLDGIDWKRWCRSPVMEGRTGDSWESHQLKAVDVVFHNGWYLMAYTGGVRGSFRIGWAMSRDGLNWSRAENPVLRPALEPGTWESSAVTGPSLMVDGDTLRMWYGGSGLTGSAIGLATAVLPASFEVTP